MSFILDANFVMTLNAIGILNSLLSLREIIVPKLIFEKETKHVADFQKLVKDNPTKFTIVDATHEQKSHLLDEIATASKSNDLEFVIETENQCDKMVVPTGWTKTVDVFVINGDVKSLKNVLTNTSLNEFCRVRKTETRRILEHADVHLCALGLSNKKSYILSMDAGVWVAFQLIDPAKFKRRICPIFRYLALTFRDDPIKFVDALIEVVKKRHAFANDMYGKLASLVCYVDLERSIEMVLDRCVAEIVEDVSWKLDKKRLPELLELKDKIRETVRLNTKIDDKLSFNDSQFIKDLNMIKETLQKLSQSNANANN